MGRDRDPRETDETLKRGAQSLVLRPGLWLLIWMGLEGLIVALLAQKWGLGTVILAGLAKSGLGLAGLVWLTGRSLLKVAAPGFRLIRLERLGTGILIALAMMLPGFALSLLALALMAPGLRAALLRRAAPPDREDIIDLEPGQWREIPPNEARLPQDPAKRP